MDYDVAASLLLVAGFMVLILSIGLNLVTLGNIPTSVRELRYSPSFLLSRPFIELNIAAVCWVLISWALSNGGDIGLFLGTSEFGTFHTDSYQLWFYQLTLLFVSVTILSNATVSRQIDGVARGICVVFYSVAVFPVLYHWLWSVGGWASPYRSNYKDNLLRGCGVIDSAGCSLIHMAGGCAGLVVLWLTKMRNVETVKVQKSAAGLSERKTERKTDNNHIATTDNNIKSTESIPKTSIDRKISATTRTKSGHLFPLLASELPPPSITDDFKIRQMYTNTAGPLLLWIGFIGLNFATNLPGDNASHIGGKR